MVNGPSDPSGQMIDLAGSRLRRAGQTDRVHLNHKICVRRCKRRHAVGEFHVAEHHRRAINAVVEERIANLKHVRRAVAEIAVGVVGGEELDSRAVVRRLTARTTVGDLRPVRPKLLRHLKPERVPQRVAEIHAEIPDRAGENLPAVVNALERVCRAGILHVRGAGVANVATEAAPVLAVDRRVVLQQRHAVAEALTERALREAKTVHNVVTVFVRDDRGVARVHAAAAGRVEIDRQAVVIRVAVQG